MASGLSHFNRVASRQKEKAAPMAPPCDRFPDHVRELDEEECSSRRLLILIAVPVREEESGAARCSECVASCGGAQNGARAFVQRATSADDMTDGLALASLQRAAVSGARQRGSHFKNPFVCGSLRTIRWAPYNRLKKLRQTVCFMGAMQPMHKACQSGELRLISAQILRGFRSSARRGFSPVRVKFR